MELEVNSRNDNHVFSFVNGQVSLFFLMYIYCLYRGNIFECSYRSQSCCVSEILIDFSSQLMRFLNYFSHYIYVLAPCRHIKKNDNLGKNDDSYWINLS